MAVVGFIGRDGQTIPFSEYLERIEELEFPEPLIHLMVKEFKTNPHKGDYISVTSLLGCQRQTYLSRLYDIYIYPKNGWWSLRGSLIHKLLEDQPKEVMVEKNLSMVIEGEDLFGRIDYFDPRTGHLQDFKTTGDKGVPFILRSGAKADHISQANMYKVLLEEAGHKVKRVSIIYISLMDAFSTGTTYTQQSKRADVTYHVPDIIIYPREKVIEAMSRRVIIMSKAFKENILPPEPDEDTRKWLCSSKYCTTTAVCPYYQKHGGGK